MSDVLEKIRNSFEVLPYFLVPRGLPHSCLRFGGPLFKTFRGFLGGKLLAYRGEGLNIVAGANLNWVSTVCQVDSLSNRSSDH
jgi:hypothetical protein